MRAERLPTLALVALTGCVATSVREDLARVRERVRGPLPSEAAVLGDVDPNPDAELRRLLAAPLTVDDAVRAAMAGNRQLRATLRELGIPRGRLLQASLPPNPAVEFDLRYQQDRSQTLQGDLTVEFALTRALLAPARASAARSELEAAQVRAAGAVLELGFATRAAFFAAQASQERLAVAQRSLDALAAGRDAARALVGAGNAPELELAAREAAYETARVAVAELELEALDRREAVVRLLGLRGDEAWSARGALAAVPDEAPLAGATEARALRASLELSLLRARMDAAARRVGLSRAEGWLPDITVDVHGEQDGTSLELGGGARVTLPTFDRRQGQTAALEAEFDGLLERHHGLAADLRSALRVARNRVRSSHARARHLDAVVLPARARVLEQTVLQYNAMNLGPFQVLQARREQLDAELAQVEARREYWTAVAALDTLLEGWRVSPGGGFSAPGSMGASQDTPEGGH
ncbi:MAG: TolC family protein [Deltaproteobacteria bacterium]|nr:TolC family protein [Deltaproteobacteria bacterium]